MTALTTMDKTTWEMMLHQAKILVDSGMLPNTVRTPAAAVAIMMKGYELGMPPMQSFAHINIIQGKPTLSPEGMLAQIWKTIPQATIDFIRLENDCCEIRAARPGRPATTFIYSIDDATKAGLIKKENWVKYPRAMHRSRCVSEMARTLFPDAIAGCSYTPDEIDPDIVYMDESGEIAVETKKEKSQPKPEKPKEIYDEETHWGHVLTLCGMQGDESYVDLLKGSLQGVLMERATVKDLQAKAIQNDKFRKQKDEILDEHPNVDLGV